MIESKRKPTFEEWKKSQVCKCCGNPVSLEFSSWRVDTHKIIDVDGRKLKGYYCSNCIDESFAYLMDERFVENYNGKMIFCKDGKYSPYWDCLYYFTTIEDCRTWIDSRNIAIPPWGLFSI